MKPAATFIAACETPGCPVTTFVALGPCPSCEKTGKLLNELHVRGVGKPTVQAVTA